MENVVENGGHPGEPQNAELTFLLLTPRSSPAAIASYHLSGAGHMDGVPRYETSGSGIESDTPASPNYQAAEGRLNGGRR
ncbi:hypothetical protein ACJ73_06008 [Blastomyces percursus]|uniref:Uncharacterized protein n=1 Tax=Blastomyces percursus TaxID=1658174 RepID=A0A1J9Q3H4_9EURO|nr:hypothetical protein ACJ73_06008 [Blastomyces percursus]